MFFLLDNYDSFVYNLYAYLQELGQDVLIKRSDEIRLSEIQALEPEGILISPGPGHPSEATLSLQVIDSFKGKLPLLGVCLGHQAIGHSFGATVKKGTSPVHGKLSALTHNGKHLFEGVPQQIKVTRYHSLTVDPASLPPDFEISARSEDDAVMAISHRHAPIYGVQFHPEAVLTEHGYQLLDNFVQICKKWRTSL